MEHIPSTESYVQKVIRIAKELDISIDKASITCDAFELAFSDLGSRQAIFGMIDQLDESAVRKGEPMGLIIRYTVELGEEGIRVGRYADEIPSGDVVELTPSHQACIFLRITDDLSTQEFLGPMIVNRPELESVPGAVATGDFSAKSNIQNINSQNGWRAGLSDSDINKLPSSARRSTGQYSWPERGCQPVSADGVVCSDSEMIKPAIPLDPSSLEAARIVICLGPIRFKLNERFPFLSGALSQTKPGSFLNLPAFNAPHHLPPWAAMQAGTPAFQSGLSPPPAIGELGPSASKDVPPALAIT